VWAVCVARGGAGPEGGGSADVWQAPGSSSGRRMGARRVLVHLLIMSCVALSLARRGLAGRPLALALVAPGSGGPAWAHGSHGSHGSRRFHGARSHGAWSHGAWSHGHGARAGLRVFSSSLEEEDLLPPEPLEARGAVQGAVQGTEARAVARAGVPLPEVGVDAAALDVFFGRRSGFEELGLRAELGERLRGSGKACSTAIQARAVEPISQGGDVVIAAETGSGKTLAYLLPLLNRLLDSPAASEATQLFPVDEGAYADSFPRAVVVVPNRELVNQVVGMASPLVEGLPLSVAPAVSLPSHTRAWPYNRRKPAPEVLVCTPAFMARQSKNLHLFDFLEAIVLDEADMLLDGGYLNQVDEILVARKRILRMRQQHEPVVDRHTQVILSAATIPTYGLKSVDKLVAKRFPNAARVENDLLHRTQPQLEHHWVEVESMGDEREGGATVGSRAFAARCLQLEELLRPATPSDPIPRTMVFANTATTAAAACEYLRKAGLPAAEYHKEVLVGIREENLGLFSSGQVPILVCTDMAARGIDIQGVQHVVQFEFASNVVQHLHRLGRTGRAGRQGTATHFVDPSSDLAERIRRGMETESPLDDSFSRKRGFKKKLKKIARGPRPRKSPPSGSSSSDDAR